jgi:hypothetical protein
MKLNYLARSLPFLLTLYVLYLIKTAMGINISEKYSAWDFVKAPIKPFIYK